MACDCRGDRCYTLSGVYSLSEAEYNAGYASENYCLQGTVTDVVASSLITQSAYHHHDVNYIPSRDELYNYVKYNESEGVGYNTTSNDEYYIKSTNRIVKVPGDTYSGDGCTGYIELDLWWDGSTWIFHYIIAYESITILKRCYCPKTPFPSKDQTKYIYSDIWCSDDSDWQQNNAYCGYGGGEVESGYEDCILCYRCKNPMDDGCYDEDQPFSDSPGHEYSSSWDEDAEDADEQYHDCIGQDLHWGLDGWVRLDDGTCHDRYKYEDVIVESALINCKTVYRCSKYTYYIIDSDSNPNIAACWDWHTGDPTSGNTIYEHPPAPGEVDPSVIDPEYPYVPPDPIVFPPWPDIPPYEPPPPDGPVVWNDWPPYTPDSEDPLTFEWCDCDIHESIKDNCGCFEKPIKNSGLACSGYVPKNYTKWNVSKCSEFFTNDYKKWTISLYYNNPEDKTWIE